MGIKTSFPGKQPKNHPLWIKTSRNDRNCDFVKAMKIIMTAQQRVYWNLSPRCRDHFFCPRCPERCHLRNRLEGIARNHRQGLNGLPALPSLHIVVQVSQQLLRTAAILPANELAQKVAIFKPFLLISGWAPGLVRLARCTHLSIPYLMPQ